MKKRRLECNWMEFENRDALPEMYRQLADRAVEAIASSYSPYSHFQVGAAALLEDGAVVKGANMENASYPLCICAEKACIANVESNHSGSVVKAIAVTALHPAKILEQPISPCGSCRQVLVEKEQRQGAPMAVLLFGQSGPVWLFERAEELLPHPFEGEVLQ